jgi:succinate dehydrogenase / fumarate reductase flavoprotein subunit
VSINGANRLGANSTAECLVFGAQSGATAAKYAMTQSDHDLNNEAVQAEEKKLYDEVFHGSGSENPYDVRNQVQTIMDPFAYVYRDWSKA